MINHIKHIALALTGLAAVISCERQLPEYSSGEYILFSSPGMTVETRSGELLGAITEDFGVLGYCIPYVQGSHDNLDYNAGTSGWEVKKANCPPTVFYKQRVSSNGIYDSEGGSANNPKYWYRNGWGLDGPDSNIPADAENYRYTFFAYFPYGDNYWTISPSSESSAGGPILTFTMPQDQGGNIETTRLDATKNIDAMLAMEKDVTRGSGDVTFEFSHILTALGFEINNFSDYPLTVHSLKLRGNFYRQLQVDFSKRNVEMEFTTTDERYSGYYDLLPNGPIDLSTDEDTPINSAHPGVELGTHILLISGDSNNYDNKYFGEDIEVVIGYKFNETYVESLAKSRPGTFTPRPGIRYTAQLNFVGDAFVLNFIVDNDEEWEDGIPDDDEVIFE